MPSTQSNQKESSRWEKSQSNKVIDGVCGGLAEHLNIDPTIVRIGWVVAILFRGLGLIAYIAAMILVPSSDRDTNEPQPKRKFSTPLIIGMILIAFAFLMILKELNWHYDWFPYPSFSFMPIHWVGFWYELWPILLIALGIGYLVYVIRSSKKEDTGQPPSSVKEERKWYRSADNRMVGGVCGGIANNFRVDPSIFRIIIAVVALATNVVLWLVAYLILMVVLPVEDEK
ncbi:PspC domain-containing protein [candidate division KSB1 bacterium]|nr:PspC domain-containing protein [candidate division KSB1 bacterium]